MSERYLKLTDTSNKGTIVKQVDRKFYGYHDGAWVRRGLSIGYFYPDAPEFECYEEVGEAEVAKKLGNEAIKEFV